MFGQQNYLGDEVVLRLCPSGCPPGPRPLLPLLLLLGPLPLLLPHLLPLPLVQPSEPFLHGVHRPALELTGDLLRVLALVAELRCSLEFGGWGSAS